MRKYLIAIFLSLMFCFPVYGADQKISEMTALGATPASDDYFPFLDSSTGVTKKIAYTYLEDIKNVNLYGGLTAAVATIGATEITLLINDAQTVTDTLSIPTTMQLFITRGGDITVSAGKVLTINGTILAGAYQIFGTTGTVTYAGNGIFYGKWKSGGSDTILVNNKDAVMANLLTGQGDIIYSSSSTVPARLAKGTALQILTMNAGATAPEWATGETIDAWIQFDGTGTIAIQDSFNVSGITDNNTGDYTVTWDTDFANDDYACVLTSNEREEVPVTIVVGSISFTTRNTAGAETDAAIIMVIATGDQ